MSNMMRTKMMNIMMNQGFEKEERKERKERRRRDE